jgi:hypothetical protein
MEGHNLNKSPKKKGLEQGSNEVEAIEQVYEGLKKRADSQPHDKAYSDPEIDPEFGSDELGPTLDQIQGH